VIIADRPRAPQPHDQRGQTNRHPQDHIDRLSASIDALTERIDQVIAPFQAELDLLATIPGIARHNAEVIVAEIGGHIGCFPSAGHLASLAGVAPGQHESAGKKKPVRTRPGNSYLQARYRRLAARRGPMRALVAIEHSLLTAIWHMLTTASPYQELGRDYYARPDPERAKNRIVRQANALGLTVRFEPIES
jgi:transposase